MDIIEALIVTALVVVIAWAAVWTETNNRKGQ